MKVFLYIWRIISPFVIIAGVMYFGFVLYSHTWTDVVLLEKKATFILGGVSAVIGIIIGFTGWAEEVPPRWFWIKSNVDLLASRVSNAISLGIQFFFIPAAAVLIVSLIFYS